MPTWKGKTRGGLLGYRIFVFVLSKIGLSAAYLLLRFVSAYYVFFAPTATKSIYSYFRKIHKYAKRKAVVSLFKNYYVFGQTLVDKVAIISGNKDKFSYTLDGEEHLIEMNKRGKGGLLISGHLGNWEIAGFLLKRIDATVNIVMFEAEHERIKKYLDEVMQNKYVKTIPIKQDLSHIFKINSALQNNELICMHGDRFMEGSKITQKEFMGEDAYFPVGPFAIAAKLNVPVTYVYAVKDSAYHYHLSSTPIIEASTNQDELMNKYIETLEDKVKKHPLQWFNYYDFWSKELKGGIYEKNIK